MAITLGNIGLIHGSLGDYAKALEYQERSLKMREELGNRAGVTTILGNIGTIHSKLGAGAVQSFAFGRRAPIVDTNVARVLFRVFVGRGSRNDTTVTKRLWSLSALLLPRRDVFDFNQALMDLGALVCVARRPRCPVCPMRPICRAYALNSDQEEAG